MSKENGTFIAWLKFQRRAFSMQPFFEFDLKFVHTGLKNKQLKIFDYILKTVMTLKILCFTKDRVIWVQLPPTPLLTIVLFYKKIYKDKFIIADCHNGLFSKKWEKYLNYNQLNKLDIIIVHNRVIRDIAVCKGVDGEKIVVLETKPAEVTINGNNTAKILDGVTHPFILVPCGFSEDEPINVIFKAAREIPSIQLILTGPVERAVGLHDLSVVPENVMIPGYLEKVDFEKLFLESDAVLGLTTEKHIQLSVANEATGFCKPMILSNTKLLQELFYKGVEFVETLDSKSMAKGILNAIENKEFLLDEVKALKKERNIRWENQANDLQIIIREGIKS